MLKSCRQGELNKHLAAWICCKTDDPKADYFLCQHCRNYAGIDKDIASNWNENSDSRLGRFDQLYMALVKLPRDQKMVIYLKIVKGLSNQDVADILSKSIGAIKAIQYRGLMNLLHVFSSGHEGIAV